MSAIYIHGVPVDCINQAAVEYMVPAELIISVLMIEGGHIGDANPNQNGTYDYGPMQINSIWLDKIASYGYTQQMIQYNPCANVAVGTWILSQAISDSNDFWQGVGDYHSHSYYQNTIYRAKVEHFYNYLDHYLNSFTHQPVPIKPAGNYPNY